MSVNATPEERAAAAEARAANAEAELARLRAKDAVIAEATSLGFCYADLVPRLAADRLRVDDEGRVSNAEVKRVVRQLAEEMPGLLTARRPEPADRRTPHVSDPEAVARAMD
jgi:hypothetical protein